MTCRNCQCLLMMLFALWPISPVLAGANVPAAAELVDSVVSVESDEGGGCQMSASEHDLFLRLQSDPGQQRDRIRCSQELQTFANDRARDMARRGYFDHLTPERMGPNTLLRESGYPLPSIYGGASSNSVEAIVAGYADVDRVWRELLESTSHRIQVLGEVPFFGQQDEIGVAHIYVPESDYGDYWVIILARRAKKGEPKYLCSPEPAICFQMGRETGQ